MTPSRWRKAAVAVLAISVLNLGMMSAAQAGIVSTSSIVQTDRESNLTSIRSTLARADIRAQMEKMGVDSTAVDQRIASMSDQELASMAKKMHNAPAGGDGLLAVIGLVFVVLMILEFTGVIDIFKRAP
jgi:hypothetical protein